MLHNKTASTDIAWRIGVAMVSMVLASCSPRSPSRAPGLPAPQTRIEAPLVELLVEPSLLNTKCSTIIYPSGKVVSAALGRAITNNIGRTRAAKIVLELEQRGFFDLREQALQAEMHEGAGYLGKGFAVVDGNTVRLTVRTSEKTNSVAWNEPQYYSEFYPTARLMRSFADCVDLVSAAGRNPL